MGNGNREREDSKDELRMIGWNTFLKVLIKLNFNAKVDPFLWRVI